MSLNPLERREAELTGNGGTDSGLGKVARMTAVRCSDDLRSAWGGCYGCSVCLDAGLDRGTPAGVSDNVRSAVRHGRDVGWKTDDGGTR